MSGGFDTSPRMTGGKLVVIVDEDGLFEWSSNRSPAEVATVLEAIAASIRAELVPVTRNGPDGLSSKALRVPKTWSKQSEEDQ